MVFGVGGSFSESSSTASSFDTSTSGSNAGGFSQSGSQDSIAFQDIFAQLFGGAAGAAGGLDPSMLTNAANSLFSGGMGFLESLGNDPGSSYLADRLNGDNGVLQEQIDLLGSDLGKFFSEQINPEITSQSVSGGQLGGGRQGVAQGAAANSVGEQFQRGAAALRMGDIQARDQAASLLSQNTAQSASAGFAGLGALSGVANMGFGASLSPYERLASILGGPTVLNTAGSTSADFATSFSNSYGESEAESSSFSAAVNF